jgi:pimeloyl-ACP methyl ester carboxylesterase
MITIKHEVNSGKSLIVLIHGFMGSEKTWVKADGTMPFISQLLEDKEVRDNFTIATFDYHSNLMTFFPKVNAMWNYIAGKKNPFNLPIESIAQLLQSQLTYRYDSYENIVLIGHSMGGLVAKRYVLDDILKHSTSRVKLYVSLATPHNGSDLATIGNALIENIQIKALKPLAEGVIKMGNEWFNAKLFQGGSTHKVNMIK